MALDQIVFYTLQWNYRYGKFWFNRCSHRTKRRDIEQTIRKSSYNHRKFMSSSILATNSRLSIKLLKNHTATLSAQSFTQTFLKILFTFNLTQPMSFQCNKGTQRNSSITESAPVSKCLLCISIMNKLRLCKYYFFLSAKICNKKYKNKNQQKTHVNKQ